MSKHKNETLLSKSFFFYVIQLKPIIERLLRECWFFQNLPWDLNIFTLFQKRVCEKQYTPCKMSYFPKIFFFSEQWLYSAGHRDSSLDPWSSQQRLRPPGRRDRSWHPVIPHERWTVDSPADHGHIYVRMSARSRQLLSDGLTWFSPEFSCPHATAPSNGKRQIEHERYGEKSPYQAPDRCHYSNAVRFDSHISRRGKQALINSSILFFGLGWLYCEYESLSAFKLPFVTTWLGVISTCWTFTRTRI